MEEQYEEIDKIINGVMSKHGTVGHVNMLVLLREVVTAALNEGFLAGHEVGYDEGYSIGFCEGAGTDAF
jgi:hypothetical protein